MHRFGKEWETVLAMGMNRGNFCGEDVEWGYVLECEFWDLDWKDGNESWCCFRLC